MTFFLIILISLTIDAQTVNVHGFVSNKAGKPISNAIVTLVRQGLKDTTGTDGAYSIVKTGIAVLPATVPDAGTILFDKGILELSLNKPSGVKVEIFNAQGSLLRELSNSAAAGAYRLKIVDNSIAANLLVIRVSIGRRTILFRSLSPDRGKYTVYTSGEYSTPAGGGLARTLAEYDTLKITAVGYTTKTTAIFSYDQTANITLDMSDDAFEPDNNRNSASTIESPGKAQAHTLTVNDTDWVKFTADSGSVYQLTLSGTVSVKALLFCGSSASSSFSFGGSTASPIWTCPKFGTWYICITSYSSGNSGTYSFTVAKAGLWVSFSSPEARSVLTAGASCGISWDVNNSTMTSDCFDLFLCKGSHQFLPVTDKRIYDRTFTWNIPACIATGNDYRIGIVNRLRTAGEGFSDTFSITGMTPDAYEPDDIQTLAHSLVLPETHNLTVNDTDWFYKWTAPPDDGPTPMKAIKIASASKSAPIKIQISDGAVWNITTIADSSAMIRMHNSGSEYYKVTSPSVGAYTITIVEYHDSDFTLHFSSPKSNDTLSIGQTVPVSWSCQVSAGGYYDILLCHVSFHTYDTLASNVAVNGTFQWAIGTKIKIGDYYIIVKSRSFTIDIGYGSSDTFTIKGN